MTKEQLIALLNDMSLEEKVNQMSQVIGGFFDDDTVITGPMAEMGFTEENIELSGSVIGSMGAETVKKIQKSYMEKHPHHIPLLFMLDIINGYKTVFPIPLGQGATFEPELSEKCAAVAAKEASVSGLHVTFAPMTDLVRDARWGRVMESTGEDPYLNGLFCESMVKGFQGENLSDEYKIAACVKHFAGYGAPTAGRDYNTVELSEHTFREFYLPSYKAGIDAGAALVMTSFNTVNGIPATGNKKLMRGILRDEMGFDGVLISDWAAIEETIYHGYCADKEDAAIRAVEAGVDIDMMTGIYCDNLCRLVREGKIPESLVDECCMRILELKNKLGLFENPYKDADEEKEQQLILCKEHRELAREAARKSFVLLKNEDHFLPAKKGGKIALYGAGAVKTIKGGTGSGDVNERDYVTIAQGMKDAGYEVTTEGWLDSYVKVYDQAREDWKAAILKKAEKMESPNAFFEAYSSTPFFMPCGEKIDVDAAKADGADTAVFVMARIAGENKDRFDKEGDYFISEEERVLLAQVCESYKDVVLVINTGGLMDLAFADAFDNIRSIVQYVQAGQEGGNAFADVFTGAASSKFPCPRCQQTEAMTAASASIKALPSYFFE